MPDNMTVRYLLDGNNTLLGTEAYQSITEITLPLPDEDGHKITLTRFFSGQASHRWLVERVQHSDEQVDLFLTPRTECADEIFLAKTYSAKRTVAARITKGTLVEVEYGFIQSTKRLTGKISSIKRYPDLVQNGEMHKRRLAIVVNSRLPTLQVIPVTSVHPNSGDKTIFELSEGSLSNLVHYNNPAIRSFGLGSMIQTVSLTEDALLLTLLFLALAVVVLGVVDMMFLLEKFDKRRNIPAGRFPAGVSDRYTRNNSGYRKAATQQIPGSLL